MDRYNRQILLPEIGLEGQKKLSRARVLIVGAGGLGSPAALYLCGAGIGTIGLIDGDIVSLTNLQRQILYTEQDEGRNKALCAAEHLKSLNSEIRIKPYPYRLEAENAQAIFSNYDIIVDGCDNFSTRYLINDTCIELGKPYVYGAIQGFEGQVSLFNFQGGPNYRSLYPNEEEMLSMPAPPKGVMGITPAIVSTIQVAEVFKVIAGFGTNLSGKLWTIDLTTLCSHVLSI